MIVGTSRRLKDRNVSLRLIRIFCRLYLAFVRGEKLSFITLVEFAGKEAALLHTVKLLM